MILAAVLVGLSATVARADDVDPEARRHLERGLALYAEGDYAEAIDALQIAYEIDPHRNILYAWAQAERLAGDCLRAVELYEEFLDTGVSETQASAARVNIERCEAKLPDGDGDDDDDDDDDDDAATGDPTAAAVGAKPAEPSPPTSWQRDPLVWSLAGGGALALGLGGWSYASARAAEADAAEPGVDHARYRALRDRSSARRNLALAATAAGSVAIAFAVWRAVERDDDRERQGLHAWADQDGGGLAWAASF